MNGALYIVDDNADYQLLMYRLLKDFTYSVRFFDSGHALYRLVQAQIQTGQQQYLPSLILLDLNMSGMNGLGLLKLFRQASHLSDIPINEIPIVIMSSDITLTQINQCYHAGANAVVTKPLDLNQMKNTIHAICRFWMNEEKTSKVGI